MLHRTPPYPPRAVDWRTAVALRDRAEAAQHDTERARAEAESLRRELVAARREAEQARAERDLAQADAASWTAERDALRAAVAEYRADLANVRRRAERDVEAAARSARAEALLPIVDAIDDVARALHALPAEAGAWRAGFDALVERLDGALAARSATRCGAVGERFDPHRHEAIGAAAGPAGVVVAVTRSGLLVHDGTCARPAAVVVGDGRIA